MVSENKIRVLLAKPGIDGHEWGAFVIARALRDSGMEVIYTGMWQTEDMIVKTALEEGVDVVGLSSLGAIHRGYFANLMELMEEKYVTPVPVVIGGIITDEDRSVLQKMGLTGFYGPGTSTETIVEHIRERVRKGGEA